MKELEASQEIVLLRDAVAMAAATGADFQDEESSEKCSEILKEAVDGVDAMLAVDCDDPEARDQARAAMHRLIFYKTMMSSDDLDDAGLRYCKHACEALPKIGWRTYARCVGACGWLDLLEEVVNEDAGSTREVVIDRVLVALRGVRVTPDLLDVFYAALRARLNAAGAAEMADALDSVEVDLGHLEASCSVEAAEPVSERSVVSSARFLVHFCKELHEVTDRAKAAVEGALRHLVAVLETMLRRAAAGGDQSVICAAQNWAGAIEDLRAKMGDSQALAGFIRLVEEVTAGQGGGAADEEMQLGAYVESVNRRDFVSEVTVERLLSSLRSSADPTVVECLLQNTDVLKPHQVSALLSSTAEAETSDAAAVQRVVRKAFSEWDFGAQDRFRGEWHRGRGFGDHVFEDSDFSRSLTAAVNRLSSDGGEANAEAAKELSLLCLQSPATTLTALFDFAVRSGQADTAVQIFGLLKSSFAFAVDGVPFSLRCFERRVLSAELTPQELTGLSVLVEALMAAGLLDPAELVSGCILTHLVPSETCHRLLRLLQVVLGCVGVRKAFETTSLPVALLRLCRLLHHCMTVDPAAVLWDVLRLKERLLAALDVVLCLTGEESCGLAAHEACWLRSKLAEMDTAVLPYVLEWLAANEPGGFPRTEVERMSQQCLLLSCSRHKEEDSTWLRACRRRLSSDRIAITAAVAKLLPRMLTSEVEALLGELNVLFADPHLGPLVSVAIVLDSLAVIRTRGELPEQQWSRAAQACITSVKAFLSRHPQMSSLSLAALATIVCHAAEESTSAFRSAVGIFLLDLFGRSPSVKEDASRHVLRAVKRLKDDELIDRVNKLLESKK